MKDAYLNQAIKQEAPHSRGTIMQMALYII